MELLDQIVRYRASSIKNGSRELRLYAISVEHFEARQEGHAVQSGGSGSRVSGLLRLFCPSFLVLSARRGSQPPLARPVRCSEQ